MRKTLVEKYVENPEHMRLFQQERAILEVTDLLESALQDQGVSRSEFAALLGKTKGWVTQLLDGEGNKTIRTVSDAFAVLGQEFRCFYGPIQISHKAARRPAPTHIRIRGKTPTPNPNIRGLYKENSVETVLAQADLQESA